MAETVGQKLRQIAKSAFLSQTEIETLNDLTATTAELNIMDGVTADKGEINTLTGILATRTELDRVADVSTRLVNLAAATLGLTVALHDGKIVTVNKADGSTITLPASSGSGAIFKIFVGTTISSVGLVIEVANATDVMEGTIIADEDGGVTATIWPTVAASDTMTLNGTTKGGILGDMIEIIDIAAGFWFIRGRIKTTGAEATPFSEAVS